MRIALSLLLLSAALTGCSLAPTAAPEAPAAAERPRFTLLYTVWIKPEQQAATVKIRLSKNADWVNWMRFYADGERYSDFLASGDLEINGDELLWTPPAEDAWLQYDVRLESKRRNGRYDGYLTADWALFRADDLVPPVRTDFRDGTQSLAKLEFNLPEGWSVVSRYPRYTSGRFKLDDPHRLVDRPTGWLVMGDIGTRRERILR